jgi:hypothetical protein
VDFGNISAVEQRQQSRAERTRASTGFGREEETACESNSEQQDDSSRGVSERATLSRF